MVAQAGEVGFGAKWLKPSHQGSVMGAPLGMAAEGDGGRWYGGVNEVVVVWWCHIWSHKQGWRV